MRSAVVAAVVALAALPAAAGAYDAGAGVTDITPPRPGAADPAAYMLCAPFTGPRRWAFDEPYTDVNGDGVQNGTEPYCDANHNGRYDRIWTSGAEIGDPLAAKDVHDPITARAFAIRSGKKTLVVVSVVAQGLFNTYIDRAVTRAKALRPAITDMVVSANHNESSPDTVGIYGGPTTPAVDPLPGLPAATGIDDYYMAFLVEQIARAADAAVRNLAPATIHVRQTALPAGVTVRLSDNWPTTDNGTDKPVAIDPKLGVIQARRAGGDPIFTVLSLAAHNQEIGHSDNPAVADDLSSDWPGYFAARVAASGGGTGIFLVGDNGSEEDPITAPEQGGEGSYQQSQATGEALADATLAAAGGADAIAPGDVRSARRDFCVPLENNLFKAAAAAGLFGARQTYVVQGGQCRPAAKAPDGLLTTVGLVDVGPDLQLILNPGEAFPALMIGSRWGFEDVPAECQGRANPPVPTWLSHARHRLQVGLANDFIGYLIPPWAYIGEAGFVQTANDPNCNTGGGSTDSAGHHHKLETEGVGPTASALVAQVATQLQIADDPDPSAVVARGRFVLANGKLSRSPLGATAVRLLDGATLTGDFIDYDGVRQDAPDLLTRGILYDGRGCRPQRVYLDVYPAAKPAPATGPPECPITPPASTPGPGTTPGPGPGSGPGAEPGASCVDRHKPRVRVRRATWRRGVLRVRGRSSDRGCRGFRRLVRSVGVRFAGRTVTARGRARWHLRARAPHRVRRVVAIATDTAGNRTRRKHRVRQLRSG